MEIFFAIAALSFSKIAIEYAPVSKQIKPIRSLAYSSILSEYFASSIPRLV